MFYEKLNKLKEKIIEQGNLVESMIEKSIRGLINKDKALLLEVIQIDEPRTNEAEIEIDEMCINLIARFQPTAQDLRTIIMILKMNNDLERIADMAENISESALFLIERPMVKPLIDLPKMAEETMRMLKDSIDSFIKNDPKLAKSVCERDDVVDAYRDQILRELVTYMISDPTTIERALHLERISRNLERIADLATNIGEDVIYIVEGKVIKHGRYKEGEGA
ncbi:phosphate transport system protein [Candidatus Kryptonium thompsonii]|jgi:phosphate transport system protein|uniref:Phosphate-specific transport system accessory protein PhoU n=1 Tax=Candidatus Kryptonium thompsonii TaxID=1633631 RepID=A0A0P1LPN7_9BACT|nr:phosphate signaling complex protein PhoU [Candidatus Kryptonium thompsoni]CUS78080.1 phosphate transport system protein [Candidatus Kryptonium thompsoni]CUS83814.1 phosphate transport system protein [Candidatus Kryptonium thompsoni]CUS87777.1 phosphate transport system protein [Candidatus Kryptonium thompsoni]CUS88192.1 phosphate transport system protein [Candidatus Kryptonium thompsoni]CUS89014.1 phosphate transport system protein [Candidatus Kryptonium thompsoni]